MHHEPEIRFEGQKRLYRLYREHGLDREAERLHKQILKEHRSQRFDLGIHLAAELVFEEIERGNWKEAHKAFEEAIGRFDSKARGHLFYGLFQPYVQTCVLKRQQRLAKDAMKQAKL